MAADLDAFFAENGALPWSWGWANCCTPLADWAVANGHEDPAADWRGLHDSAIAWRNVIVQHGGMLPFLSDVFARAGLPQTDLAVRGVIGVIGSRYNVDRQWGAIHDGARWQVRTVEGYAPMIARTLGMWSV